MNMDEYQTKAHGTSKNTRIFGSKLIYPLFGLAGESGEVLEKAKKRFRDDESGTPVTDESLLNDAAFKEDLTKELGDILWYIAETATRFEIKLDDIAQKNIDKLYSRMERGKITGSGDNR